MKTDLVEIGKQQAQIDTMKQTVDFIVNCLNVLENLDSAQQEFIHKHDNAHKGHGTGIMIIVKTFFKNRAEDILAIASKLISLKKPIR